MLKVTIFAVALLVFIHNYKRNKIISSASIWVACYIMIFVVYPVYQVERFKYESVIDLYALGGIIVFFIGVLFGEKYGLKTDANDQQIRYQGVPDFKMAHLLFWMFFCASMIIVLSAIGPSGVLSLIQGKSTTKSFINNSAVGGLYLLSVRLHVPCVLSMWMTAETKKENRISIIVLGIYIFESIVFSYTRIFLIAIVTIAFLFKIRNIPQKKQVSLIMVGVCGMIVAMMALNFVRVRGVHSIGDFREHVSIDYMFESTDFGASYKFFDKLLDYPSPYINPIVYLKPLLAFIPRSIWSSKPEQISLQVLRYTSPELAASGYSSAGNSVLGEGYAIMGIVGLFLFPFIWGVLCGKLDDRYYERLHSGNDKCVRNICYYIFAVFIVISGQRGDWCQYMETCLYLYMFPVYFMSKVSMYKKQSLQQTNKICGNNNE